MSELGGIQQVLQLTPVVERAQTAIQPHSGDLARQFERELVKVNEDSHDKTQETLHSKDPNRVKDDESRGGGGAGGGGGRGREHREPETKEQQAELIAETGHGGLLDIKA